MPKTTTLPGQTGIQMPDESAWAGVQIEAKKVQSSEPHGRIIGIDYEKWAVAWEDARQKPARLAERAQKLEAKGFRELQDQNLIAHGVEGPVRVWVMPRHLYEQRRQVRDQNLVDRVNAGLYPESALSVGNTRRAKK